MRRTWIALCLALALGFTITLNATSAQGDVGTPASSYRYQDITATYTVHEDSTVTVEERLTIAFMGAYHTAWRSIPLNKIGGITDVSVFDSTTNLPLAQSTRQLNKLDPTSWGKFTSYRENRAQNIAWYFNLTNTVHTWTLRYTVHGAISFGKTQDRWYWNVFTDYDVPVDAAKATMVLPQVYTTSQVPIAAYRTNGTPVTVDYTPLQGRTAAVFSANSFAPQEAFTIDVGWPAGLVSQAAYWRDFVALNYGWLLAIFLGLATVIAIALRWFITEKLPEEKSTIIPQYEPPEQLKPAMAEIICTEQLSDRGLAATVIDLAIRGYIRIEEDQPKFTDILLGNSSSKPRIIYAMLLGIFVAYAFSVRGNSEALVVPGFLAGVIVIYFLIEAAVQRKGTTGWKPRHYRLTKTTPPPNGPALASYEQEYLQILFQHGDTFATREVKHWSNSDKLALSKSITQLKKDILKETETDTQAYVATPSNERHAYGIRTTVLVFVLWLWYISLDNNFQLHLPQYGVALVAAATCAFVLWSFFKFEARLSQRGIVLKEEWLGFKMYLETAERYRLQNLTPDQFERFLPYAMVFKVEKQWAQAFAAINLLQPTWYAGAPGAYGGTGGVGPGGFSATAFSASFASSFTSAFASAGGGGGGVGGGGAGGGGGGGGGGAG